MSKDSVLIIDSNEAFATILKEGLEQGGEYQTTIASNGDQALQALSNTNFDLVIVDLGLDDPDGATFARTLREQQPDQGMMLIPLMGEDLPSELANLDIQGVLPKPFFFPELPGIIGSALGREVEAAPPIIETPVVAEAPITPKAPPVVAPPPVVETVESSVTAAERVAEVQNRISEKRMQSIIQAMNNLAQDIGAASVILSCEGGLIAHAGRLSAQEATGLAQVVGENWRTSARVARILGQEQLRFEQSVEGGEHLFYSLAVAEDIILSAAVNTSTPLGMIRHSTKSTADALQRLVG
ncbi:MAG: response regulator transcription factor [Chloroflexi bacterium]|nr:response regulator transcription factor [Chloroflexota bacterium]